MREALAGMLPVLARCLDFRQGSQNMVLGDNALLPG